MMERFLFPHPVQGQPIGKLSGGEGGGCTSCSLLMEAPNILLLDEPTNDLDVTTPGHFGGVPGDLPRGGAGGVP